MFQGSVFMISFLAWTCSPILIFETGSGSKHPTRRVQIGMVCGNFGCRSFGIWGLKELGFWVWVAGFCVLRPNPKP